MLNKADKTLALYLCYKDLLDKAEKYCIYVTKTCCDDMLDKAEKTLVLHLCYKDLLRWYVGQSRLKH